jgi:hypothetical protein
MWSTFFSIYTHDENVDINLMYMVRFCNSLHQVRSKSKYLKAKKCKYLGANKNQCA